MDYSKLSDAQLLAMHSGDFSKLSDSELTALHSPASPTPSPAPEEPGVMEALLRGGANGATLGFRDELQGLKADPSMGSAYSQARDSERTAQEAAHKAHPWAYNIGQFGGGAVPALAAAPLAGAATVATGIGALAGLGNSQADVTQGDVGGAARDTALGGALGYGLNKVGSYIANKFGGASQPAAPAEQGSFSFPVAKAAPQFDPANPPVGWQPKNPDAPQLKPGFKDIFSGGGAAEAPAPTPAIPESAAPASAAGVNPLKTVGGFIGQKIGSGIHPMLGYPGSKAGEYVGEKLGTTAGLDKIQEMLKATPQAFGRWAPSLISAAQKGGNALAVQHFLLMQNDSEYRKQVAGEK